MCMRSLIWGAGAIGGTLGAYLARAGKDVTMVDTVVEHMSRDVLLVRLTAHNQSLSPNKKVIESLVVVEHGRQPTQGL